MCCSLMSSYVLWVVWSFGLYYLILFEKKISKKYHKIYFRVKKLCEKHRKFLLGTIIIYDKLLKVASLNGGPQHDYSLQCWQKYYKICIRVSEVLNFSELIFLANFLNRGFVMAEIIVTGFLRVSSPL